MVSAFENTLNLARSASKSFFFVLVYNTLLILWTSLFISLNLFLLYSTSIYVPPIFIWLSSNLFKNSSFSACCFFRSCRYLKVKFSRLSLLLVMSVEAYWVNSRNLTRVVKSCSTLYFNFKNSILSTLLSSWILTNAHVCFKLFTSY